MRHFHNLLYATTGISSDIDGLKQALSIARNNQAALTVLLIYPELSSSQEPYREKFGQFMVHLADDALRQARAALAMEEGDAPVHFAVESSNDPPAIIIIRHVLRHGHDLLIKEAETKEGGRGFLAMDMTLLRKCPCPVWLARPITRSRNEIRVAVAINPDSRDQAEHDLSVRLLELSRSLADTCSGELDILSCWDFEFERYLRGSSRADIPEEAILGAVRHAQSSHSVGLSTLIQQSGITGTQHIQHLKGRPEDLIPAYARDQSVDILVMGSVARTGILGFVMGNTAENIMRELDCALVALKPGGFVSPVRAY